MRHDDEYYCSECDDLHDEDHDDFEAHQQYEDEIETRRRRAERSGLDAAELGALTAAALLFGIGPE
jgi:hypothetical protein